MLLHTCLLDNSNWKQVWHNFWAPEKVCPQVDNVYRLVTLTSNVMKVFEKIITQRLCKEVEPFLVKYQFAYIYNSINILLIHLFFCQLNP